MYFINNYQLTEPKRLSQNFTKQKILKTAIQASLLCSLLLLSLLSKLSIAAPLDPELIEQGREIFTTETFAGNGRTCATCHRIENNFTLDPAFIKTLPDDDPLFIAEHDRKLSKQFENPRLMRQFGLILTNPDGFDDLNNKFSMRAVPHLNGIKTTIDSVKGPMLGLSGDSGPLRTFANAAVKQHMTKSLSRIEGIDFRLPTDHELKAMEAFMLTIGRQEELKLPLALTGLIAQRGQEIYLDDKMGKCNICHLNGGANGVVKGVPSGNVNFDTGVEALEDNLVKLIGERLPTDDGFGSPGNGAFNSTPVIEAADTSPYMHNNSVLTLEGTVSFYNSAAFNNSKTGKFLASLDEGKWVNLNNAQVNSIAEFMRVLNVLENIRSAETILQKAVNPNRYQNRKQLLSDAYHEINDAQQVANNFFEEYPTLSASLDEVFNRYATAKRFPFGFTINRVIKALREVRQHLLTS